MKKQKASKKRKKNAKQQSFGGLKKKKVHSSEFEFLQIYGTFSVKGVGGSGSGGSL